LLNPDYSERGAIAHFDRELAATAATKPPRIRPRQFKSAAPVASWRRTALAPARSVRALGRFIRRRVAPALAWIKAVPGRLWPPARHAAVLAVKWLLWLLLAPETASRIWGKVKRLNSRRRPASDPAATGAPNGAAEEEFAAMLSRASELIRQIGTASLVAVWHRRSRTLLISPEWEEDGGPATAAETIVRALRRSAAYRVTWRPGSPLGLSTLLGPGATVHVTAPAQTALHQALVRLIKNGCRCFEAAEQGGPARLAASGPTMSAARRCGL